MYFKLVFVCFLVNYAGALYEGEQCIKDSRVGVCVNLNKCQAAIQDIRNRKNPQICSFDHVDPIVCCLDHIGARPQPQPQPILPLITTTKRPVRPANPAPIPSDMDYVPPVYDYELVNPTSECEPIPTNYTTAKTGQKAFDKCIEYQEKYVYPCGKGMALLGEMTRMNNCHHNANKLIVGGTDAAIDEFPHMVMLGYGDKLENVQWQCGGAVISERFILTAGHCIASRDLGPVSYVVVGAYKRSDTADRSKIYKVKQIIKHPEFKPPVKYNDIALLETEKTIELSEFVVPACIHTGEAVDDSKVLATGWGLTQYKGSVSEALQKVILKKFSTEECAMKYTPVRLMNRGFDPQSQLCYGDKTVPKDTCQGDSGGPVQIKSEKIHCMYTVVGVTSFGRACGFVGEPGIYTRVADYVPWIEGIVWPGNN